MLISVRSSFNHIVHEYNYFQHGRIITQTSQDNCFMYKESTLTQLLAINGTLHLQAEWGRVAGYHVCLVIVSPASLCFYYRLIQLTKNGHMVMSQCLCTSHWRYQMGGGGG